MEDGTLRTILLVEDDQTLRYSVEKHLAERGYRVIAVADSMAALRELDSNESIDLLVSDVVMPNGRPHGLALGRMARMRRANLPVLFITGYADLVGDEDVLAGQIFYKPIDLNALTEAIDARLAAA